MCVMNDENGCCHAGVWTHTKQIFSTNTFFTNTFSANTFSTNTDCFQGQDHTQSLNDLDLGSCHQKAAHQVEHRQNASAHLLNGLAPQSLPVEEHPIDTLRSPGLVWSQFIQLEPSESKWSELLLHSLLVFHWNACHQLLVGFLHWPVDLICVVPEDTCASHA